MERQSASSDDFDSAVELFSSNYSLPQILITPSEQEFRWSHKVTGNPTMTFRSTQLMATIETVLGAGDEFVVQWGKSGTLSFDTAKSSTPIDVTTPIILPNGRSSQLIHGTDLELSLIHIDKQFVRDVAEGIDGVQFDSFVVGPPTSPRALRTWRSAVNMVATLVLDSSTPSDSLLSHEINRLVAVAMLDTFAYESTPHPHAVSGNEPIGVKNAYEFVYNNAQLPISIIDIAGAAHLSVRSLQQALRRYRDTTPIALLRSVRLTRVHEELHTSEPSLTSVMTIARAWGFVQMGRFAGDYRNQYGESPSDTLRRSSRSAPLVRR